MLNYFLEFCCMCVHINATLQGGIGWFFCSSPEGAQLSHALFSYIMCHSSNVFLGRHRGKVPALPVPAVQGGADGTARRGKDGPLGHNWGMFREQQPVVLLVSHCQQENFQPAELRVFPLGACFCQILSDLWNPANCPEYLLNQACWQGWDPESFWCPLCCLLSFLFLLPGLFRKDSAKTVSEWEMLR